MDHSKQSAAAPKSTVQRILALTPEASALVAMVANRRAATAAALFIGMFGGVVAGWATASNVSRHGSVGALTLGADAVCALFLVLGLVSLKKISGANDAAMAAAYGATKKSA